MYKTSLAGGVDVPDRVTDEHGESADGPAVTRAGCTTSGAGLLVLISSALVAPRTGSSASDLLGRVLGLVN
jgi:hypothetical protein